MTGYTFSQLFDFTRTTAGTFVGSNGLIQNTPASVNLLTFTQEFDNAAWTKDRVTVSANVTIAPDGTSTADKVVDTAAGLNTYRIYNSLTLSAVSYTQTFYAKAAEYSWCYIRIGSAVRAWFDLTNGTVGTVEAGLTASITPAGNGWYRIACTIATATAGAGFGLIGLATGNNVETYTPTTGGMGIFIWGAQLEVGSTATTYTRNNGGVFPARFDYDPVTLAPRGILIEEQRTNLLTYSDDWSNAIWAKSNVTITANSTTAPDGTVSADTIVATAAATAGLVRAFASTATAYTFSVYLKQGNTLFSEIEMIDQGTVANRVRLTYATGALTVVSGTPTGTAASVGNGWWRVTITYTFPAIGAADTLVIYPSTTTGSIGENVFAYGAQLEAGAFATSYIPTVASQVTRSADICTITAPMFAPWYNQTESTFVVEASSISNDTGVRRMPLALSDAALTFQQNKISPMYDVGSFNVFTLWVFGTASIVAVRPSPSVVEPAVGVTSKLAFTIKSSDTAAAINGNTPGTATTAYPASLPMQLLRMGSENILDGQGNFNGHIRRITYYPFRASNNQLQALTT